MDVFISEKNLQSHCFPDMSTDVSRGKIILFRMKGTDGQDEIVSPNPNHNRAFSCNPKQIYFENTVFFYMNITSAFVQ